MKIAFVIGISIFILLHGLPTHSFEKETHRTLSERAIPASKLDNFLKTELAFSEGVTTKLVGNAITDLIGNGSIKEDDSPRFCNHFHNPLSSWSAAGLQIVPNPSCQTISHSLVLWGQKPDLQPFGEKFTWQDARDGYFKGLTAPKQNDREEFLRLTFRTLGYLIHLVQDAANPAT